MASSVEAPHISSCGCKPMHVLGRDGKPNSAQRRSLVRCGHSTPAGLPFGSASQGEIEGAIQHAPQPGRQSIGDDYSFESVSARYESACERFGIEHSPRWFTVASHFQ